MGTTDIGNSTELRRGRTAIRSGREDLTMPGMFSTVVPIQGTSSNHAFLRRSVTLERSEVAMHAGLWYPPRMRSRLRSSMASAVCALVLAACAGSGASANPEKTLSAYSQALEAGRAE